MSMVKVSLKKIMFINGILRGIGEVLDLDETRFNENAMDIIDDGEESPFLGDSQPEIELAPSAPEPEIAPEIELAPSAPEPEIAPEIELAPSAPDHKLLPIKKIKEYLLKHGHSKESLKGKNKKELNDMYEESLNKGETDV